jgi:hypothetical protein
VRRGGRAALVTALAVAALASGLATPAPASATPHWYGNGQLITTSVRVLTLARNGQLMFNFSTGATTCSVKGSEFISNPSSGEAGIDELTGFSAKRCEGVGESPCESVGEEELHISALGLPWRSHLESSSGIRDVFEGVMLEARCTKFRAKGGKGGVLLGVYSGTLAAKVGNGLLEFEAAAGLTGGEFGPLTVTGTVTLKGKGHAKQITAA